jgi:hypothetical protein
MSQKKKKIEKCCAHSKKQRVRKKFQLFFDGITPKINNINMVAKTSMVATCITNKLKLNPLTDPEIN